MEQYALYLILKKFIKEFDSDFKVSFNDMDFNKPNYVGIYIKGGETSNYRDMASGQYFNFVNRVQFILQGDKTNDGLFKVLALASKIRKELVELNNKVFEIPQNDKLGEEFGELQFGLVKLLGEVNFKEKSTQGLPVYSINFKLSYFIRR